MLGDYTFVEEPHWDKGALVATVAVEGIARTFTVNLKTALGPVNQAFCEVIRAELEEEIDRNIRWLLGRFHPRSVRFVFGGEVEDFAGCVPFADSH